MFLFGLSAAAMVLPCFKPSLHLAEENATKPSNITWESSLESAIFLSATSRRSLKRAHSKSNLHHSWPCFSKQQLQEKIWMNWMRFHPTELGEEVPWCHSKHMRRTIAPVLVIDIGRCVCAACSHVSRLSTS